MDKKTKIKNLLAPIKRFDEYWNNLKNGGYFEGGVTTIENFETDIPFVMMMCVAKGYLKRGKEE